MEFTERRYSVLLVSSSPKFNESMLAVSYTHLTLPTIA